MMPTDRDFRMSFDGTNATLAHHTGDLIIKNNADDGDIIFSTRSGGSTYHNDALVIKASGNVETGGDIDIAGDLKINGVVQSFGLTREFWLVEDDEGNDSEINSGQKVRIWIWDADDDYWVGY